MQRNCSNIVIYFKISFNKLVGVYCLDLVTPGTYLHNTMDKTDIVHACWKTKYRTENIEENKKI